MKEMNPKHALVVFSGGQDSTTCLYWSLKNFGEKNVEAVFFEYGQRHAIEKSSAQKICKVAGIPLKILPINTFSKLGSNSLVGGQKLFDGNMDSETSLPKTFVPGRNLIFLTFAAAYAYENRIKNLVTGVSHTDYSGYPDCRRKTMDLLEKTLMAGMEGNFSILTPLIDKTKAETVLMAKELGALPALKFSHTCYQGSNPPCGQCPACRLRAKGFEEAGVQDPLLSDNLT